VGGGGDDDDDDDDDDGGGRGSQWERQKIDSECGFNAAVALAADKWLSKEEIVAGYKAVSSSSSSKEDADGGGGCSGNDGRLMCINRVASGGSKGAWLIRVTALTENKCVLKNSSSPWVVVVVLLRGGGTGEEEDPWDDDDDDDDVGGLRRDCVECKKKWKEAETGGISSREEGRSCSQTKDV
jgi:hypothetical protein